MKKTRLQRFVNYLTNRDPPEMAIQCNVLPGCPSIQKSRVELSSGKSNLNSCPAPATQSECGSRQSHPVPGQSDPGHGRTIAATCRDDGDPALPGKRRNPQLRRAVRETPTPCLLSLLLPSLMLLAFLRPVCLGCPVAGCAAAEVGPDARCTMYHVRRPPPDAPHADCHLRLPQENGHAKMTGAS